MMKFSQIYRSLFFIILIFCTTATVEASTPFPIYPEIQPNISFWKKVYGTYSSQKGILHDREDLNIIYAVVDLVSWEAPGAAKINRQLIKLARKRIKRILFDLGHGKTPETKEEKRIYRLFPKTRHTTFLKARDRVRLQIGQKDRFRQGVIRSGKYMSAIKKILRKYKLPAELAYLPHVESSFAPHAQSKAGALGLWQITRGTGKNYLSINNLVDERLDPILSTHAAAKILQENYSQLKTWPLAITAYNYGRAGMHRAVKQHKKYVKIFSNYRQGYFKFASRNFYSEFIAAVEIARQLEKSKDLIQDRPEGTITTKLAGYASFGAMKNYFRISHKDMTRLNPALLKPVTSNTKFIPKGYTLRLPATKQNRIKIKKISKSMLYKDQRPDSHHIVQPGDTAGSIAAKYKTTTNKLVKLNKLDNQATIRIGQRLAIPQRPGQIMILQETKKKLPGG